MTDNSGSWKVYDVGIEGVGMVKNYRNQFKGILSKKPPEDLINTLKTKTQNG